MYKSKSLFDILFSYFGLFFMLNIILLSNCYLGFSNLLEQFIKNFNLLMTPVLTVFYLINKKYDKSILYFFLYCFILLLSCGLGSYSNIKNFFNIYNPIINVILLLDMGLKYNFKKTIKVLFYVMFILIVINFITIVLYPNGMYNDSLYNNNWFFKYDNTHFFMYLPALLSNYLLIQFNNKIKLVNIIEILLITFCVVYCKSTTTMVSYFILVLCFIFKNKIHSIKIFNIKAYLYLFIAIFLIIIVFKAQNIFNWFIVDFLHKDLTFTSRTDLWEVVTKYISLKPLLGYGLEGATIFSTKMGRANYTHAHNTILDILYKSGFIGFVFYVFYFIRTIKILFKYKGNIIINNLAFFVLSILITMNFEAREEKIGLYVLLVIIANLNSILSKISIKGSECHE